MQENAITTTESKPRSPADIVRHSLDRMAPEFAAALPPHVDVKKFIRVTMTAVQTTPALLDADRRTLFAAATRAAQMGLLPDGREGVIATFKGQCQFMPMVAGVMKLVRNSGEIASIDTQIVYSADKFTYRPGIDAVPQHEPDWFGDRGNMIGVYAVARMKDGAAYVEIMNKAQIDKIRSVSRSKDSGPWVQWYDEMARKSVIRRMAKRLPMSTDLDGAVFSDDDAFEPAPQPHAEPAAAPEPQPTRTRPSRLDKVAAQAPVIDEDGVIDVAATDASPSSTEPVYDDSPI